MADVFHKRGASITSMLQGLEKKGYIERRISKDNEREKIKNVSAFVLYGSMLLKNA